MIGKRIDVGDVRIADRDVGEILIGANVLGLADRHRDGRVCTPLARRCAGRPAPPAPTPAPVAARSAALIQPRRISAPT